MWRGNEIHDILTSPQSIEDDRTISTILDHSNRYFRSFDNFIPHACRYFNITKFNDEYIYALLVQTIEI